MTTTVSEAPLTEGMQVREVQVREVDAEKREIRGIAVPYGETYDMGYVRERFERGALEADGDVLLFSGHDHRSGGLPIGIVTALRDTDQGAEVVARISETPKGDEVYRLARDGVLTKFSVGFDPVDHRVEDEDVIVHTRARLKEVSIVPFPAYETATINQVRERADHPTQNKETVVETTQNDAVAELRDTVTDLERRLAVLADTDQGAPAGSQFRSAGEILKALASGDDAARTEFRDFGSTVEADVSRPGWVQRPLKLSTEKRKIVNLFNHAPLPQSGNTVEYPVVKTESGTVEKQASEGTALAYMEVALDTGTATVGTYGGFSSLSRQAIERSDQAYLDAVLRYQAIQYGKATNLAVRNELVAAAAANTVTLSAHTAKDWIAAVIDAAGMIEDDSLGLDAEFIVMGRDVFKTVMSITDSADRPVFAVNGDGANTIGSANLVGARGNIGGLPVAMIPGLPADFARVASSEALTVLESAGAPFRLQDESVVNLTKDFSLYGYLATTINDLGGLVALDVDLIA